MAEQGGANVPTFKVSILTKDFPSKDRHLNQADRITHLQTLLKLQIQGSN